MPKRSSDVEQRRRDADDAVEEDLGHEPAQQVGRDGALVRRPSRPTSHARVTSLRENVKPSMIHGARTQATSDAADEDDRGHR